LKIIEKALRNVLKGATRMFLLKIECRWFGAFSAFARNVVPTIGFGNVLKTRTQWKIKLLKTHWF